MSRQELANFNYCTDAIDFKKNLEVSYLELAQKLYKIKTEELYKPHWESWVEYAWEFHMSMNAINTLIRIYTVLVLEYELTFEQISTAGGWSVVGDALAMMTSRKEALHWIAEASNLSREDLRKVIIEKRTGVQMSTCKHKDTHLIEVCDTCGEHWAVTK